MRRFWTITVVLVVAIAMSVPAAAKKPDNPGQKAPNMYMVTMEFVGEAPGFSTTTGCTENSYLTMQEGRFAINATDGWPEVRLPGVEWYRYYPYYATPEDLLEDPQFDPNLYPLSEADRVEGVGLTGCHGGGVDVYVDVVDGVKVLDHVVPNDNLFALWLNPADMDFLWHSDYYIEFTLKHLKKKTIVGDTDAEDFTLTDVNDSWTWDIPAACDYETEPCSGVVTGSVRVTHFSPGAYVEFPGTPVDVEFLLTVEPLP
ncbi:MAG: hypothetical protein HKN93_02700 [Acidimicrobiia bacterium]|nr:hypothetical protein [Acidimicrobiia bacterium]